MAFYPLAKMVDLHEGYAQAFKVAGKSLLLIHEGGRTCVIDNHCPHMDAPLATGKLSGGGITCRAHGITFSLTTGAAQGPLADTLDCLQFYSVAYDGNKVGVEL